MNSLLARKLRVAAIALLIVTVVGLTHFAIRAKPDFLTPPKPNGYDLILAATEHLEVDNLAANQLEAFVQQNSQAFQDLKNALLHPSEAPARNYDAETTNPLGELGSMRELSTALLVKARLARQEERWSDAGDIYLDSIRLGQRLEHCPLVNLMVGSAIELITLKRFEEILPHLSAPELAKFSVQVQELNNSRLAWDQILRRERHFMVVNSTNFIESLRYRFSDHLKNITKTTEERYLGTAARTEILAATMAASSHSMNEKKRLARLEELVPEYLPALPIDPYTRSPLLIASSFTNFVIYSAGPNKQNDQAKKDDITLENKGLMGIHILAQPVRAVERRSWE